MSESVFGPAPSSAEEQPVRQPIGRTDGRYVFFKVRRYGKLHFEKRPAEAYAADLQTLDALRKEFELGYGLDHPGLVRYLTFEDGAIYEEFIDGLTISEMIARQDPRLHDPEFLRSLCRQLLDALDYLHQKGILHLDIKPENVMITAVGSRVKILDLGAARSSQFDRSEGFTPEFMAPEQAAGAPTGPATDIYLVGQLMAALTRPFGWDQFISRATDPDPARRFQTCAQALQAIPQSAENKPDDAPKGRGCLRIFAFVMVICAIAIWWSERQESEPEPVADELPMEYTPEFNQARALLLGQGVEQDEREGMRLMLQAAEAGDRAAQCYVGLTYRDGSASIPRDPAKSLYWIRRAADQGYDMALEEMGMKYYEGFGVEQDYAQALQWWERAAQAGKASAYSSIGILYRDGQGVDQDLARAEENFLRGARAGNSYCAYLLGRLYAHYFTPARPADALRWLQKASDMGSHRASEVLANAYRNGDPELALKPDSLLATKYTTRLESADAQ